MNTHHKKSVSHSDVQEGNGLLTDKLDNAINREQLLREKLAQNAKQVQLAANETHRIEQSIKELNARKDELLKAHNNGIKRQTALENELKESRQSIETLKQALHKYNSSIARKVGEKLSASRQSESRWTPGDLELPWGASRSEQRTLQVIGACCFLLLAMLSFTVPFMDTPELSRHEIEKIPPQLARLINEKRQKKLVDEFVKPVPDQPTELQPVEKQQDDKLNKEVDLVRNQKKAPPKQSIKSADRKNAQAVAKTKGVLKHTEALAKLRSNVSLVAFDKQNTRKDYSPDSQVKRSIIAGLPGNSSKEFVTQTGVTVAQVGIATSTVEYGSGNSGVALDEIMNSDIGIDQQALASDIKESNTGNTQLTQRSNENIRNIFDRNKGALSSLYQRELRQNPELKGKVVLELVILPSGEVSECRIDSSDLSFPKLERKLASRCRTFNFGSLAVAPTTVRYPLVFSPF